VLRHLYHTIYHSSESSGRTSGAFWQLSAHPQNSEHFRPVLTQQQRLVVHGGELAQPHLMMFFSSWGITSVVGGSRVGEYRPSSSVQPKS
jgi:hypothetical protein